MKSSANPITNSPMFFLFSDFIMLRMNPTAISGTARIEISALNPSSEMIQAVIVVPILAPIITPIACKSVSSPALTNPTTITVVALEDCIMEVMTSPVITPLKRFDVIEERSLRSLSPAAF